jgi:hypothetical protein
MPSMNRLAAVLTAGLLVLGGTACAPDETEQETGIPGEGDGDAGFDVEGAEPEGGIGTEPAEGEGPTG